MIMAFYLFHKKGVIANTAIKIKWLLFLIPEKKYRLELFDLLSGNPVYPLINFIMQNRDKSGYQRAVLR